MCLRLIIAVAFFRIMSYKTFFLILVGCSYSAYCDDYKNYSREPSTVFNNELIKADPENIHIENGNISVITKDLLSELIVVRQLEIRSSNVSSIEEGAFNSLHILQKLSLKQNLLQEIKKNIFSGLKLEELDLSDNLIKIIDSEAFDFMPNLKRLSLRHNNLETYDSRWFVNTPSLTYLNFENNLLRTLPKQILGNDRFYYVDLNFGHNQISEIDERAFYGIYRINRLYLDHNSINKLANDTFKFPVEIRDLRLNDNLISCLSIDMEHVVRVNAGYNPWRLECFRTFLESLAGSRHNSTAGANFYSFL